MQNPTTELATGSLLVSFESGAGTPARTSTLLALFPITTITSVLKIIELFAGPNPFGGDSTLGYTGTGVASVMSVEAYDLAGHLVWAQALTNMTKTVWNGTDMTGASMANGACIHTVYATGGANTSSDNGGGKSLYGRGIIRILRTHIAIDGAGMVMEYRLKVKLLSTADMAKPPTEE